MLQWWRQQSCKYTFFTWNFRFAQNIVIFRSDSVFVPAGWLICRISRKWTRSMANVSFELPLPFLVPFHSLIVELWECLSSNYQIVVSEFQMSYILNLLSFLKIFAFLPQTSQHLHLPAQPIKWQHCPWTPGLRSSASPLSEHIIRPAVEPSISIPTQSM